MITSIVSIHAPARGATVECHAIRPQRAGFYPRAREGRDLEALGGVYTQYMFLSTRPRGARQLYSKRLEITKL